MFSEVYIYSRGLTTQSRGYSSRGIHRGIIWIRSTRGWYAYYWNAFLFSDCTDQAFVTSLILEGPSSTDNSVDEADDEEISKLMI